MEEVIETPRLQFVGPLPGCLDSGDLERAVALVAAEVGPKARLSPPRGSVLNVLFAAEDEIRALNHEFLGVDGVTDILSFGEEAGGGRPDVWPSDEPAVFGELVLCPDYVTRYARRVGTEPAAELLLCFVHGFLHLLGLDHGTPEEEDVMFHLQDRVVRRLGHSPRTTYRRCSAASRQP